ncbi:MAG: tetratricopeptide repeat protein [Rhodobacteraceae bacterium]|nr:tetratricopeptide repeat protein [Paracoccaceae bacterium]
MKRYILAIFLAFGVAGGVGAQQHSLAFGENARLDELFAQMQGVEGEDAGRAEHEVLRIFRQSGSEAMDLLLARGYAALEARDSKLAIWHFSALIDHAPAFAEGYNARATAYFVMGRYGEALADIEQALALNPRNFGALVGLGAIEEDIDNLENALKAYKLALALNPHSTEIADSVKRVEEQIFIVH